MYKKYEAMIVITNRSLVEGDFLTQLKKVLRLHPHALILREKDLADCAYEELAKEVEELCRAANVPFFWHSRPELARKNGCRKIHLSFPGFLALDGAKAGDLRSFFEEISVSCHSEEEVKRAAAGGATQIVLGTIFETECKKGRKGKGLEFVQKVCRSCPIPVYAIGGINEERLNAVMDAGAAGGCMMSGFMDAKKQFC